jgi:cysteinyl-tRNA synthetase
MRFYDYLFPVKLKDLERLFIEYEKAMDDHPSQVQVFLLWLDHKQLKVSWSSKYGKGEEGKDNRKG